MTKFFKNKKKNTFGAIFGPFCPNLGKNEFFSKKGLCKFFDIPIINHLAQNPKTIIEPFLRKKLNDRQVAVLQDPL